MQERTWSVGLSIAIGLQAQLEDGDSESLLGGTVPRQKASEEQVSQFETTFGERLPESYRQFLLRADGWTGFYFTLDLFGLPELQGDGKYRHARTLLETYDEEEVLDDSGLTAADLLPAAAGQSNDLVVVLREDRPKAGTVVWFDGEEYSRVDSFADFVEDTVAMLQDYLSEQSG